MTDDGTTETRKNRGQRSEVRKDTKVRDQKRPKNRGQRSEIRKKDRGQRSEVRDTEDQMTDDR
jgi:hypothetical protein